MSAAVAEDDGVQVPPLHLMVPPRAYSITDKVIALCRTVGREHHPEQRLALEVLCGRRADGRPATRAAAIICGRQNLKTYVLENYVLARLVDPTDDARLFVWTAQQLTTTEETYRHFLEIFTSDEFPHMARRYKRSKSTNGAAEIELTDGRRIKFKARSVKSGQGLTGDVVVLDEGFAVEPEHLGSLIPTLSTRKRAQVLWGSSAAHASSESLRQVVARGRSGDPTLGYAEWAHPGGYDKPGCTDGVECKHAYGTPGCVLDDRECIRLANPLAGVRLEWETLDDERKTLTPLIFARERLGWHMDALTGASEGFSVEEWEDLADDQAQAGAGQTFAFDIARNRRATSVAVASRLADGRALVELVARPSGSDALVDTADRLAQANPAAQWVAPDTPAVRSILGRLRDVGIVPRLLPPAEVEAAHGNLQDAVKQQTLVHLGDEDLSVALAGAQRRDTESGWVFTRRRSDVDISPLYAVLSALWEVSQGGPSEVF